MNTELLLRLIEVNDNEVDYALKAQIRDGSRNDGGISEPYTGLPTPTHVGTGSAAASMVAALYSVQSRYYQSKELLEGLHLALDFIIRRQHEDGTISLGSTNYNSPPDTAFMVNGMAQIYKLLIHEQSAEALELAQKVRLFLERSIPAMLTGGVHTPNHRWVICSALAWLHHFFQDEALHVRANQWLEEGLDCTLDGEWTERSNGIYNAVTNITLIFSSMWLNRPELLEPVRRNLEMMAYLVYDDGEVVTDYSGRQDWGARHMISEYFLCYQWMAQQDQQPLFATMFDLAGNSLTHMGSINNHALLGSMVLGYPELEHIKRVRLPDGFIKALNTNYPIISKLQEMASVGHHGVIEHSSMHTSFGSPLVRCKNGVESALIMTRTPAFFSMRKGSAKLLAVSIASTFSPGILEMERLTETENGFVMSGGAQKGYYGPISRELLPPSAGEDISPWYLLPHQHRPLTHVQQQNMNISIEKAEEQWRVKVESDSRPDVITQITLLFSSEMELSGEGLELAEQNTWYWTGGALHAEGKDGDELILTGGQKQHNLVQLRNAMPQGSAKKVVINLVTPFEHELVIAMKQ